MTRNLELAIGLIGGMVFLCMCLGTGGWLALRWGVDAWVESGVVEDPAQAAAIFQDIIDYDLPSSYREEFAMDLSIMKKVFMVVEGWTPRAPSTPIIALVEMPFDSDLDEAGARRQLENETLQAAQGHDYDLTLAEENQSACVISRSLFLFTKG